MPAPSYYWKHDDSRGLDAATRQGVARGQAKEWARDTSSVSTGTRVQDLRAIALASCYFASHFEPSSRGPMRSERALTIQLDAPTPMQLDEQQAVRRRIAAALQNGLVTLALTCESELRSTGLQSSIQTHDDATATSAIAPANDAGWIQIAIIAICVGGATFAQCYLGQKASEVVDRFLSRRAETQQLVATQSSLVEMAGNHTEAEVKAGKPLPANDVEQRVLALHERNVESANQRLAALGDLPSPFTGTGALTSGFGLGLIALGLWAAYEVFGKKEVRS